MFCIKKFWIYVSSATSDKIKWIPILSCEISIFFHLLYSVDISIISKKDLKVEHWTFEGLEKYFSDWLKSVWRTAVAHWRPLYAIVHWGHCVIVSQWCWIIFLVVIILNYHLSIWICTSKISPKSSQVDQTENNRNYTQVLKLVCVSQRGDLFTKEKWSISLS